MHGLAYLGVALVFTGVLGFVIFAFGDVGDAFRPVAELALPLVCFGSAAFLHRRGAPFVSAALEFLGGLVLPIVGVASFVDGAEVPPDLDGAPLVVALVSMALVLAGAYALVVRRRPRSPLRYLVAPMVWLAMASLGLAFAPEIPGGRDVSRPFSLQWALVAAAVAATLGLCRRRPDGSVARASVVAAIPGAALAALMTVLAAPRSGWPAGAMVLAGVSTLVSIELLAPRLRAQAVTVLQAATVVGTAATLGPQFGGAWAAAVAAVALLALAEWQALRRADPVALAALLAGAAGAAAFTLAQPGPTVAVATTGLAWSAVRRYRPLAGLSEVVPVVGMFAFPVMAATGLVRLIPLDTSLVVLGGFVVAIALTVRVTAARRDDVMAVWVPVAAGAVAMSSGTDTAGRPWLGAVAAGLAAIAFALAPRSPCLRVWATTAAAAVSAGWVAYAVGADVGAAAVGAALLGTALVGLSFLRRVPVFGHLGLAGHAVTAGALVMAFNDAATSEAATAPWVGSVTVALGLVALGWVATTVVGETRGCAVRDLIVRIGGDGAGTAVTYSPESEGEPGQIAADLPPVFALLAVAAFVPAVLVTTGVLGRTDPWLAVAASAVTVAASLLARFVAERRPLLAGAWAFLGVWLTAVLAFASAAGRWPAVLGAAAVVVAVVAVGPVLRRPSMIWLGWVASAALALAGARVAGVSGREVSLVLFSWAAAATVGGLAVDDALCGRRRPGELARRPELRPGVALGMVVAPLAFLPVYGLGQSTYGWWSLLAAGVGFVVAYQLRRGVLSGLGWGLLFVAYLALAPWEPLTRPWTVVPAVLVLVVAAELAQRFVGIPRLGSDEQPRPDLPPPPGAWPRPPVLAPMELRWDLPPFVVAHGVAVVALLAALANGWIPATWIGTGALGLVVAGRLRAWPWAVGGVPLVLVGAGVAGPGWLTLALAVVSVACIAGAVRSKGEVRLSLQIVAALAAGGAWYSLGWWQAWDLEVAVVATAVASAVVAAVLAVGTRWLRLGLDWLATWAALPLVGLAFAAGALSSPEVPRSPARFVVAAALAVVSVSGALLASPTGQDWLWEASAALLVAAGALAGPGWLTLTFAVVSIGAVLVAVRSEGEWRLSRQIVALLAAGGAWCSLGWWQAWDLEVAVVATAVASAVVAAVLAVGTRWLRLGLDWLATWAALPLAGLVFAADALSSPEVPRSPARFVVAAALAVVSVSAALLASPTGQDWLREASAALLVVAGVLAGNAAGLSPTAWVVLSAGVAAVATVGGLALHLVERAPAWRRPALVAAASATAVALVVAVGELPARPLLVAALLVAGVELLVLGLVTRRVAWLLVSTATLLTAWLVFASEALTGDPQWFTVPAGLAVLVMVALLRWDGRRSETGLDPTAPPVVGLDLLGMTLVVGSALVQTVSDSPSFGLLAVAFGLGLVAFGVLTRVRRRLFFGAATALLALLLMVVPPLAGLVDEIRGWVPWALLAGAGIVALLVAAFLEQGRRFVRRSVQRFSELTEGWE